MRKCVKKFVAIVAESFPLREPIYEFGSLQVPGQEGFADLRSIFPGQRYIGADMRPGPGVDVILDLHRIALPDGSAGTVLCLDTLEHVEYPHAALSEIHRILAPSGIAVISSVMDYPVHDYPLDYWRFTPMALTSLLKPFSDSFVGFAGKESFPDTVVGLGFKDGLPDITDFMKKYRQWQRAENRNPKRLLKLITPPLMQPLLPRLYAGLAGVKRLFRV